MFRSMLLFSVLLCNVCLVPASGLAATSGDCACRAIACRETGNGGEYYEGGARLHLYCAVYSKATNISYGFWEELAWNAQQDTFNCQQSVTYGNACSQMANLYPECQGQYEMVNEMLDMGIHDHCPLVALP